MGFKDSIKRFAILGELWQYVRTRKRWWMGSIILVLVLLSIFIVLVEGSAIAPFIYALPQVFTRQYLPGITGRGGEVSPTPGELLTQSFRARNPVGETCRTPGPSCDAKGAWSVLCNASRPSPERKRTLL